MQKRLRGCWWSCRLKKDCRSELEKASERKKIVGELDKRQSKSIDAHVKFMEKMEMKEYIEDELDERQHTNVSKKLAVIKVNKLNCQKFLVK